MGDFDLSCQQAPINCTWLHRHLLRQHEQVKLVARDHHASTEGQTAPTQIEYLKSNEIGSLHIDYWLFSYFISAFFTHNELVLICVNMNSFIRSVTGTHYNCRSYIEETITLAR